MMYRAQSSLVQGGVSPVSIGCVIQVLDVCTGVQRILQYYVVLRQWAHTEGSVLMGVTLLSFNA